MTIAERFRSLPRSARWLIWGALGLLAYFVIVEPIVERTSRLRILADSRAGQLAKAHSGAVVLAAAQSDIKAGVQRFGMVELPGEPKERSEAFSRRVGEILQAHGVRPTSTVKETPLGNGPLLGALGSEYKVDRLVTELQFDASPATVAAVLADLERAPEVAAVSRVQVRKAGPQGDRPVGKVLRTTIAVEAWQLVRKAKTK